MKKENINQKIKKILIENVFMKNILMLVGGTIIGQLLIILSSPIITRLYTPDQFGVFSTYLAIIGIISTIITLRYHIAIPIPNNKKEALNLLFLSINIVFMFSVLSFIIIILLKVEYINIDILSLKEIGNMIYIIPFGILGIGLYSTFNYWAIRDNAYKEISKTNINQGIGTVITQIGLGIVKTGSTGLIIGQIIGHTAGIRILFKSFIKKNKDIMKSISFSNLLHVIIKYKKFPLYSTWTAIVNAGGAQLPVLILAFYFGSAVTGFYAIGLRVMQTPMKVIGNAVSQVFYSNAVKYKEEGTLEKFVKKVFLALLQIGLPILFLFGLLAEDIFILIFGEEWGVGGIYASYLVPWVLLVFISSPLSIIPSLFNRQGYELIFQLIMFFVRIITLIYFGLKGDPQITILAFSLASAIIWLIFIMWNMSLVRIKKSYVLKVIIKQSFITMFILSPIILVQIFLQNNIILIGAITFSVIIIVYITINKLREVKNV